MKTLNNGFIQVNRDIFLSKYGKSLDKIGLIIFFLSQANYEKKTININGNEIYLEKGSCIYSQLNLANHFNKSIGRINKQIKDLQKFGFCENKNTNKFSLLVIKNDFLNLQPGKQNENKMKHSNKEINNNINIIIEEIQNYFFKITGIKEIINNPNKINISFDDFKKSFDNYFLITESKETFYNYKFTLNNFLTSKKGYEQFLTCKIENFISFKNMQEMEIKKVDEKRKQILNKELEQIRNNEILLESRRSWLIDFRKSETYLDNIDKIRLKIVENHKNATFSNSVFMAYENEYIRKNFNCPY